MHVRCQASENHGRHTAATQRIVQARSIEALHRRHSSSAGSQFDPLRVPTCQPRGRRLKIVGIVGIVAFAAAFAGSGLAHGSPTNPAASQAAPGTRPEFQIDRSTALALGRRIWFNEGRGNPDYLVWWNKGEAFASLGIAHFIWYPEGGTGAFRESFPALLRYFIQHGVSLPPWLERARHQGCPWRTRTAFLAARSEPALGALRTLLEQTIALQARYVAAALAPAYTQVLKHAPHAQRSTVEENFRELASSEHGLYALTDYLNFKGDGTHHEERYRGQGWGLLQVLLEMSDTISHDITPSVRFAVAAARVLERRVANSPAKRHEARWLAGWKQRLLTYHPPGSSNPLKSKEP